jgi:hypothetical protein
LHTVRLRSLRGRREDKIGEAEQPIDVEVCPVQL